MPWENAETVICEHDGARLEGFVVRPSTPGPHPAVVVIHGGEGINHIVPEAAQRLAEAGYLAIAADMIGPEPHWQGKDAVRKASAIFGTDPTLARRRSAIWIDVAATLSGNGPQQIAAIGYCFGGHCVLELARSGADLRAIVSFHGILTTRAPAEPGAVKAEIAAYCAGRDEYVPIEQIDALRAELYGAGASFQITTFAEAEHTFTETFTDGLSDQQVAHHALARRVSWDGTMAFLDHTLRGG